MVCFNDVMKNYHVQDRISLQIPYPICLHLYLKKQRLCILYSTLYPRVSNTIVSCMVLIYVLSHRVFFLSCTRNPPYLCPFTHWESRGLLAPFAVSPTFAKCGSTRLFHTSFGFASKQTTFFVNMTYSFQSTCVLHVIYEVASSKFHNIVRVWQLDVSGSWNDVLIETSMKFMKEVYVFYFLGFSYWLQK